MNPAGNTHPKAFQSDDNALIEGQLRCKVLRVARVHFSVANDFFVFDSVIQYLTFFRTVSFTKAFIFFFALL